MSIYAQATWGCGGCGTVEAGSFPHHSCAKCGSWNWMERPREAEVANGVVPARDDGGQAFPSLPGAHTTDAYGMTLLDWFAGQALVGLSCSAWAPRLADEAAKTAYKLADAMLEARKVKNEK